MMVRWGPEVTDVVGSVRLCGVVMLVGIRFPESAKKTSILHRTSNGSRLFRDGWITPNSGLNHLNMTAETN